MENQFIIIEGEEHTTCNNTKEIVEKLLDKDYLKMNSDEKRKTLDRKALLNCLGSDLKCVKNVDSNTDLSKSIITKNETSYILSLLAQNKVVLLENTQQPFFTRSLNLQNLNGNYIVVNKFAESLLKKYLKEDLAKDPKEL